MRPGVRRPRVSSILAAAVVLVAVGACTRPPPPPPPTTTTSTTTPGSGHDHPGADKPYTSVDDPRLTPAQQQRARDLVNATVAAMKAPKYANEWSLQMNGYTSIRDSDSGVEHFINWKLLEDGKELDPSAIESVVMETKPGQPKRVIAAMYFLENGKTMADAPDIAGPLTVWHNHKDLCWDPGFTYIQGVFRLGRCIPWGTLHELNPMLHVWVTPNECGPFAEIDDTMGIIDKWLRDTGQLPPKEPVVGCAKVHGGDHG
jgi:hypothetical protein